jgi:hypothetical protein
VAGLSEVTFETGDASSSPMRGGNGGTGDQVSEKVKPLVSDVTRGFVPWAGFEPATLRLGGERSIP